LRQVTKPFAVIVWVAAMVLLRAPNLLAQQPFYTDDADVTEKGKRHLECSDEYDGLPQDVFPSLRQNTLVCKVAFGLPANIEVGADAPLLTIRRASGSTPRTSFGVGDTDFAVLKWNFRKPPADSHAFSLAIGFNIEFPTGRAKEQLGSGLHDYVTNFIVQKKLTDKTTLHLNSGVIFAGNQTTGAIGVANSRGQVYTQGSSIVRQFTPKLDLGAEIYEAFSPQFQFTRGQLQGLLGGNYEFHRGYTFDFGLVLGAFAAAPRAGIQLGFSHDF
jgi:outer membrane putative beta-barrel porin/alpha-amylase